jgi:hypothetical protein
VITLGHHTQYGPLLTHRFLVVWWKLCASVHHATPEIKRLAKTSNQDGLHLNCSTSPLNYRLRSTIYTGCVHSEESSSSPQHPIFTNHSCSPFNDIKPEDVCEVGSYISYAIDVHTQDDAQKALKFAKKHNLRIVVRNTGHE